jgi:hypothetical protein
MRKIQLCLLVLTAVFATGCPNKPSSSFTNKNTFVSNVNEYLAQSQLEYNAIVNKDGVTEKDKEKAKRIRNDAIEMALAVIDDNYTDFITNIETRRSRADFLLDVIELGMGAATGISKGERPNQILGIALTAFRGGRTSRELNFYKQQTTPILISKMDGNRANVLAGILNAKTKDVDEYSLKTAIRDLVAYNNAGTLIRAFTELSKDTSVQTKKSEDAVRVIKGDLDITSIPTIEEEQRAQSSGALRRSLARQELEARTRAEAIPIPTAASTPPTAAEQTAIETATAARAAQMKPIRLKLEAIWKAVQADDKFSDAVEKMKGNNRIAPILANLETAPDKVTEKNYLQLIDSLTATVASDAELSKKLLAIIQRVNG